MKKYFIFLIISISSCKGSSPKEQNKYSSTSLKIAWNQGDKKEVSKWIDYLLDTTLSDKDFYSIVADLSDVTSFVYGNADPSENQYWEIPKAEREIYMKNTAVVYQAYKRSCLFMRKASWEQTLLLQDMYWNDTSVLSDIQIALLQKSIDSLCR